MPNRSRAPDDERFDPALTEPIDAYLSLIDEADRRWRRMPEHMRSSIALSTPRQQRERMLVALTMLPPESRECIRRRLTALRDEVSRPSAAVVLPRLSIVQGR